MNTAILIERSISLAYETLMSRDLSARRRRDAEHIPEKHISNEAMLKQLLDMVENKDKGYKTLDHLGVSPSPLSAAFFS